jgi:hypothetical protein
MSAILNNMMVSEGLAALPPAQGITGNDAQE